ncbi:hypothetical protein TNCV_1000121 [Trichonephila clavipes]|nr:hypothetical protein TNCV_1000121 [Trichonephila clavipes]
MNDCQPMERGPYSTQRAKNTLEPMNLKPMCECTYICSLPISVPSRDMNSIDSTQQSTQEPNPLKARVVGCLNSQSRAIMGKAFNDIHSPLQSRCVGKNSFLRLASQ